MRNKAARRWAGAAALALTLSTVGARAEAPSPGEPDYQIHPGFKIERIAAEPVVLDPVDMAWDENGRLYVLEMPGYPISKKNAEGEYPGRIVIIEDKDDDGVYDTRKIFATDFAYADSILPWSGGLLVASPPDLLYLEDRNGDGVADERRALLTGFMVGNAQHNFNGLTWGLDNWIWIANGGNPGAVRRPEEPREQALKLEGFDMRFNPRNGARELTAASSGGHGLAFDEWGHFFSTHNTAHVHHSVFPQRYLDRNPHVELGGTLEFIGSYAEGSLTRVYPIGEQQTRVNHPEQSGYFSGACGISYYGGGAFGPGFDGSLFVGDVVLNLLHRMRIEPDGAGFRAVRGEGDEKREFFATTDRSFRPVYSKTGPDGAFYLIDFHRDVIEHPEWIPDEIEKDLDVRAGELQGRIYRITPKAGLPRVKPKFSRDDLRGAVARLGDRNKWFRDTAQRMLVEWRAPESIPLIRKELKSENALARLHAMWTLEGLEALGDDEIAERIADSAAGVRENALIIGEPRLARSKSIRKATVARASDEDARVRMQAALSLGVLASGENEKMSRQALKAMREIARADAGDEWIRAALLSGLGRRPLPEFQAALADARNDAGTLEYLKRLAEIIGSRKEQNEVAAALRAVASGEGATGEIASATLDGLNDGLGRGDRADWMSKPNEEIEAAMRRALDTEDPEKLKPAWLVANQLGVSPGARQREILAKARAIVANANADFAERVAQMGLLEFAPFEERQDLLFELLDQRQPVEIQLAAMKQLAGGPNEVVAPKIIEIWKKLGPQARWDAGNILLYRRPNHEALLDAFESGQILVGQMNMDLERRRALLRSRNEKVRERAKALFNDAGVVTRAEAMEKMKPALTTPGDSAKGHKIFMDLCSKCHMVAGEGSKVGPDLTEIYRKSRETLLHDIIDPNAAVDTEFMSYTVETEDGSILSGIVAEQSAANVTLREGGAKDTIVPRAQIKEMTSNGLSLMPEELEKDMAPETMADLLAFLQQPK